jgi:hypothetical protein
MAQLLHFWLSCFTKSFGDAAGFVGNKETGIGFIVVVAGLSLGRRMAKHANRHGWATMRSPKTWVTLLGDGGVAFIALWAIFFIAAPWSLHRSGGSDAASIV